MNNRYVLKKRFRNFYTKKSDTINLTYKVHEGYDSIEETKEVVTNLNQNPDHYAYIEFMNKFYAVSMENLPKQVVISKEIVYTRINGDIKIAPIAEVNEIQFDMTKPRIGSAWNDTIAKDLEQIQGKPLSVISDIKRGWFQHNAIILLGMTFFDTKIPVFQLNVMDGYFQNSPSRWRLWARGVKSYNPFTREEETSAKIPYTFEDYQLEEV